MKEGRSAQKRIHCRSLLKLNQGHTREPAPRVSPRSGWKWVPKDSKEQEHRPGRPEARGQLLAGSLPTSPLRHFPSPACFLTCSVVMTLLPASPCSFSYVVTEEVKSRRTKALQLEARMIYYRKFLEGVSLYPN